MKHDREGKACCPPGLRRLDHLQVTLPPELVVLATWLPWLALPRANGKTSKAPALPRAGSLRPIDCRGAGLTLPEAHHLARQHSAGGVGVALSPGLGLAALDVDLPLATGAQALLSTLPGYAERSPGGGAHLWLRGSLPRNRRRAGIEVLGHGFVTVTGEVLGGRGRALGTLSAVLERLEVASAPRLPQGEGATLTDCAVLQRLYTAANGPRTRQLLEFGDWAGAGYPTASEGDFAAVRMLRFYCTDPVQLARLMQGTALCRAKWGQGDYLARTIRHALNLGGPVWCVPAG